MTDENSIIQSLYEQNHATERLTLTEFEQAKAEFSSEVADKLTIARLEQVIFRVREQLKERNEELDLAQRRIQDLVVSNRKMRHKANTAHRRAKRWRSAARTLKTVAKAAIQEANETSICLDHTIVTNETTFEWLTAENASLTERLNNAQRHSAAYKASASTRRQANRALGQMVEELQNSVSIHKNQLKAQHQDVERLQRAIREMGRELKQREGLIEEQSRVIERQK